MTAYRIPTVAAALLVLTIAAGCLGGADSPAVPTEMSATGGGGGDGTGDADGLSLTDPEAALRDAGSFTATWQYVGTDANDRRSEVEFSYQADLDEGRTLISSTTRGATQVAGWEMHSTDEVTYARFNSGGNVFYQVVEQERDVVSEAVSYGLVYGSGADASLNYGGTETFDGVTVERYEITEADSGLWAAGAAAADQSAGGVAVTDFRYVVLVDGDGLARYESWSYTGETDDGQTLTAEWEYTLTGVGSTAVEDPDWLAEAKAQVTATG